MIPGIAGIVGGIRRSSTGIEFVGGKTDSKVGATSGTSTISLSSGLTGGISASADPDDFVIAVFATGATADRTLSITDGTNEYTLIGTELYESASYNTNLRIAYKFIGGDTSVTFGPTGNAADAGTMAVYVFRGVNPTTPLDVAVTTSTATGTSIPNPPSITPTTTGAYVVCVGASAHTQGVQTFTSSDLTDFLTVGSDDTTDSSLGIGHFVWTSGSFNAAQFGFTTSDGAGRTYASMSIALRPE
jgi:hypothetical protein